MMVANNAMWREKKWNKPNKKATLKFKPTSQTVESVWNRENNSH